MDRNPAKAVKQLKTQLLTSVCASLIKEPNFTEVNSSTFEMKKKVTELAKTCPEFVLKLALYLRSDLNIRGTANFMVALAAVTPDCLPYLRAYVPRVINLPTDWIQIAEFTQGLILGGTLSDDDIPEMKGLPTSLRKALRDKFPEFSEYQLAKHNKEGSILKKSKLEKEKRKQEDREDDTLKKLTLKRMIRMLHISEPVYNVMCLTGQKYPTTDTRFEQAGLSQTHEFDSARAGKRMKLAAPATWEVHLSAKGNKAETWEYLLDMRPPLPFMAMLRNLRNFILTGISPEHHKKVQGRLCNAEQVASSRQFPFRFFSAYEAIKLDLSKVFLPGGAPSAGKKGGKGGGKGSKRQQKQIVPKVVPTEETLESYKSALDTAVKHATTHNIKPIYGRTVVLCNVKDSLNSPITAQGAKGVGSIRTMREVSLLLALMFKYSCESCDLRLYNSETGQHSNVSSLKDGTILQNMEAVLDTVSQMQVRASRSNSIGSMLFPFDLLNSSLRDETWTDNIIVVDDTPVGAHGEDYADGNPLRTGGVSDFLKKMRQTINPSLLYVSVDIKGGSTCQISDDTPNDVFMTGFSDSILRFVAERGGGQLDYVERIDEIKKIAKEKINFSCLQAITERREHGEQRTKRAKIDTYSSDFVSDSNSSSCSSDSDSDSDSDSSSSSSSDETDCDSSLYQPSVPYMVQESSWNSIRIFVSSTFLDMQSERHALSTTVFPTLRQYCHSRGINLHITDIDMRWGITTAEANAGLSMNLCLNEVERCKPFFLGLVGDRYGYCPSTYDNVTPDEVTASLSRTDPNCFEWLSRCPPGKSLTHLEMLHGALGVNPAENSLFYVRDSTTLKNVNPKFNSCFGETTQTSIAGVSSLKQLIREKHSEGVISLKHYRVTPKDGQTLQSCLDVSDFTKQVTEDLWRVILQKFGSVVDDDLEEDTSQSKVHKITTAHEHYQYHLSSKFFGRVRCVEELTSWFSGRKYNDFDPNMIVVSGVDGVGKTALAAFTLHQFKTRRSNSDVSIIQHYPGCMPGSNTVTSLLERLLSELMFLSGSEETSVPNTVPLMCKLISDLYEEVLKSMKLIIFIDGIDQIEPQEQLLRCLPSILPTSSSAKQLKFITTCSSSPALAAIGARNPPPHTITLQELDAPERKGVIKKVLKSFGKKIDERTMLGPIVRKQDAGSPLYLSLVLEHLRLLAHHDSLGTTIKYLPTSTAKYLESKLSYCENLYGGRQGVKLIVAPLAATNTVGGLSETQLRSYTGSPHVAGVVTALFTLLKYDPETGALTIRIPAFLKAVKKRYIGTKQDELSLNKQLAIFALTGNGREGCGDQLRSNVLTVDNNINWLLFSSRRIAGLIHHSIVGQAWVILETILCEVSFIEHAASQELTLNLFTAFHETLEAGRHLARKLIPFQEFLEQNAHILQHHPQAAHQSAINTKRGSAPFESALKMQPRVSWFQHANKLDPENQVCIRTQRNPSAVASVALSRDNRLIAIGREDWKIAILTQKEGKEMLLIEAHTGTITNLHFSPTSDSIASVSSDCSLLLSSTRDGASILQVKNAHSKPINSVSFGKTSDYILTAGDDTLVKLWDVHKTVGNRALKVFKYHTGPVTAVRVHVEGQFFASASWDTTIKVYNPLSADARCVSTIHTKLRAIRDLSWMPSLVQTIAVASCDGRVRVFDVAARHELVTIDGHFGRAIKSLSYSNDGKWLVTGDTHGCVKMWRSGPTGEEILAMTGHHRGVNQVLFSSDSRTVLSGSSDNNLRSWNRERITKQSLHSSRVTATAVSFSGNLGISVSRDTRLRIVDLQSSTMGSAQAGFGGGLQFTIPHTHDDDSTRLYPLAITSVCVTANEQRVITGAVDGQIRVWKTECGVGGSEEGHIPTLRCIGHKNIITGLCVFGNNQLYSVSWDRTIRKWLLTEEFTGEAGDNELKKFLCIRKDAHDLEITSVSICPRGSTIATSSYDMTVRVWNSKDLEPIRILQHHTNWTTAVAYHPLDNALLVSVGLDGNLCLWDLSRRSSEALITKTSQTTSIRSVSFLSQDIIVTGTDEGVQAWTVTPKQSESNTLDCDLTPAGCFFTTAPCTAVSAIVTASEEKLLWCGDMLGNTYRLVFNSINSEWSCKSLRVVDNSPKFAETGDVIMTTGEDSSSEAESDFESYTTWETVDPSEIYPGRGGVFKKFSTAAERKKYLLDQRNAYIQALKNRRNITRERSVAARQHYNQSIKTGEVMMMLQNMGIM